MYHPPIAKTTGLPVSAACTLAIVLFCHAFASAGYVWQQIATTGPSARYDHTMVYDSARQVALLFGGRSSPGNYFDDLWQWDSAAASWTPLTPQGGVKPAARYGHAMAYDRTRDKVVVFGGWASSGGKNDLWEWNPLTSTWTEIILPGPLPAARFYHGMAYDPNRAQMVLHGGSPGSGALGDTWEWNGNPASAWVHKSTLTCLPGMGMCPRFDFGMAFDGFIGKVVLFGGTDGFNCSSTNSNYDSFDFTYEWNGTSWGIDPQTGPGPDRRFKHEFVWDNVTSKMVLYGGTTITCVSGGGVESDTWGWNKASDWAMQSATSPHPRAGHAMVFDETIGGAGGVILHGGYDAALHGNTLVGYEIPVGTTGACPPTFDLNNPSSYRHRLFEVTGTASGNPWSWSISWGGFTVYELNAPGVASGSSAAALAAAFVASINAQSCPSNQLAAFQINGVPNLFRVVIGGNKKPHLCVGPAGQWPTCCVSSVNSCSFNPVVSEILFSGEDCNMNGEDDTIDLLSDPGMDGNGDGIIDSCQWQPGDMNCDGEINGRDIAGFVLALTDPLGYEEQNPECPLNNADVSGDGFVTIGDVEPFAALLN